MSHLWVGTSGWVYKHWLGPFYREKTPGGKQLDFYAQHFSTVEINYSYYHLPERSVFEGWQGQAPDGFLFAVKGSRYLTHMKKLNEPLEPVQRLLDRAQGLGGKLGPILFQFPKWWQLHRDRLAAFLEVLGAYPDQRFTFEFRHQSWLTGEVYNLLRAHNAALCLPVGWGIPLDVQITANWTYVRFHGGEHGVGFTEDELRPWADRLRSFQQQGMDAYVYFNNDPDAYAIRNAQRLREMLGESGLPARPPESSALGE